MIKAAFFDIDGTLVSFKTHRMSESTKACLYSLREKGIKLFVSTGRPKSFINNLDEFPFDGFIYMNGALVVAGESVLLDIPLDRNTCQKVASICARERIPTYVFLKESFGINCMDENSWEIKRMINSPEPVYADIEQLVRNDSVYEFTVFMTEEQERTLLSPYVGSVENPRWHPAFMDIIPPGLSKAKGAEVLLDHFGIKASESVAFGDGGNDVPIIKFAGIGVAMGNADCSVKSVADYVTSSVDDDGIADAFRQFGLY